MNVERVRAMVRRLGIPPDAIAPWGSLTGSDPFTGSGLALEPVLEVADQRRDVELAQLALDHLLRGEAATVAVELVAKPRFERREVPRGHHRIHVPEVSRELLPQLAGDDVAQRVGREVADRPARPV